MDSTSPAASKPDTGPYLEAYTKSAERVRSTLYLLVLTLIAAFGLYRTTVSPDWLDARARKLDKAIACWKYENTAGGDCHVACEYARAHGLSLDDTAAHKKEIEDLLEVYRHKRAELRTLEMPVLALKFDVSDLWLWTGVLIAFLLAILHASLLRERANRKIAVNHGVDADLIESVQVIRSSPLHGLVYIPLFMPVPLQLLTLIAGFNSSTADYAFVHQGYLWRILDMLLMLATFLGTAILSGMVISAWRTNQSAVTESGVQTV